MGVDEETGEPDIFGPSWVDPYVSDETEQMLTAFLERWFAKHPLEKFGASLGQTG